MVPRLTALLSMFLVVISMAVTGACAAPPEPDTITKEQLLPLLGKPDVTVIDLRFGRDWYDSNIKIKSATREDPLKPGQWLDRYPKNKMLILYCD